MAALFHVRSNSFPSRQNPQAAQVDEHLCRLRSSEAASTSSSSIGQQLNGLHGLHGSLEKLLQLHLNQQALAQEQNKKIVEELLDGSLRLLDVCNIANDALSQTKGGLSEIQSILRRRRGDLSNEVKKFLASRKSLRKSFQKVLRSLKATDKYENDEALAMLREAEATTASVFASVLCFISCSNRQSKPRGKWSLALKLVSQKREACEEEDAANANEFARMDAAFHLFIEKKSEKTIKIKDVQSLEMCIQDLEEGLESLFRSMIKVRVSVLNIVAQ